VDARGAFIPMVSSMVRGSGREQQSKRAAEQQIKDKGA
jgi:hypothetical protein